MHRRTRRIIQYNKAGRDAMERGRWQLDGGRGRPFVWRGITGPIDHSSLADCVMRWESQRVVWTATEWEPTLIVMITSVKGRVDDFVTPRGCEWICPNLTTSNTLFLQPMRVSPQNGISIGSDLYINLQSPMLYTSFQWTGQPAKLLLPVEDLGPPELPIQTASRSVQPLLQGSRT